MIYYKHVCVEWSEVGWKSKMRDFCDPVLDKQIQGIRHVID